MSDFYESDSDSQHSKKRNQFTKKSNIGIQCWLKLRHLKNEMMDRNAALLAAPNRVVAIIESFGGIGAFLDCLIENASETQLKALHISMTKI